MGRRCVFAIAAVLVGIGSVRAEQFSLFPDRKELRSPDGRFVVRSVEHTAKTNEFSGVFRSLTLEDASTGVARRLYDYVGRAAVAWSGNQFIIVTDYVSKRTARALVFRVDQPGEYLVIDKTRLAQNVSAELRSHLEGNDHVYLEVSRLEAGALTMRVWGYGARDAKGFRFLCTVRLNDGMTSCRESGGEGLSAGARH